MTLLSSTLFGDIHRFQAAEYRRVGYVTNGWDLVKRWDGRSSALEDAGIPGPATDQDSWVPVPSTDAGSNSAVGIHVFRYRYLSSSTGYVSNPSEEREVTANEVVRRWRELCGPIPGTVELIFSADVMSGGNAVSTSRKASCVP